MSAIVKIHPVILAVPDSDRGLRGRDKVAALSHWARKALKLSADYSQLMLGPLDKQENGAPIPSKDIHWSLTHRTAYVAAVCAPFAIGIDIEKMGPISQTLFQRIADASEWALAPSITEQLFCRYWTAKEAVLKAVGKGLMGLSLCRIQQIVDGEHVRVTFEDSHWTVSHFWGVKDHIVTITAKTADIVWHQHD